MKKIVIYSQDGCPYCSELKESLINDGKSFTVKDIEKYESEWELVVERTGNEYVPVACVIDTKYTRY